MIYFTLSEVPNAPHDYEDKIFVITIIYFIFGVIVYSFKYDVGFKVLWKLFTVAAITWNLYSLISGLITAGEQFHWIGHAIVVVSFIFILGPGMYATLRYSFGK